MPTVMFSSIFLRAAVRRLSWAETDCRSSSRYELNGTGALRDLLGDVPFEDRPALFVSALNLDDFIIDPTVVTWYTSRSARKNRSPEWWLSCAESYAIMKAGEDDLLVVGLQPDGTLILIVARDWDLEQELASLFCFGELDVGGSKYQIVNFENGSDCEIGLYREWSFEELGISVPHYSYH